MDTINLMSVNYSGENNNKTLKYITISKYTVRLKTKSNKKSI